MDIKEFFKTHSETAVAFSGGVDSSVLLLFAKKYAKRVKAYFVKSVFQPQFELNDALETASLLGVELEVIEADVLSDEVIASNPKNRCYFCKKRVFSAIINAAARDGFEAVIEGTNASDNVSDRPGFKALGEYGVLSPLKLCGFTKADIRAAAKENGIPVFAKPSYACLATRIPAGTSITAELLEKTEKAESELMNIGFTNFRVRYLNGAAKLELCKRDFSLFCSKTNEVRDILLKHYDNAYLDLKERADE